MSMKSDRSEIDEILEAHDNKRELNKPNMNRYFTKRRIESLIKDHETAAQYDFARTLWDIRFCNDQENCDVHSNHELDLVLAEYLTKALQQSKPDSGGEL